MNKEKDIEWIESTLESFIDSLRPEIRNRFVYGFSDEIATEGKNLKLADCAQSLKPPLITFYSSVILKAPDLSENLLWELVNHEVLHTFYGAGEGTATMFQKTVDFSHTNTKKIKHHRFRNFLLGLLIWYCLCFLPPKKKVLNSAN